MDKVTSQGTSLLYGPILVLWKKWNVWRWVGFGLWFACWHKECITALEKRVIGREKEMGDQ